MAALIAGAWMTQASADEFLVGAEIPLTGNLARVGAGMQEGIMVAAEVFNKTNGKHKIKIVTVDDESAPAKAIAAVEKLVARAWWPSRAATARTISRPPRTRPTSWASSTSPPGGVDDSLVPAGARIFLASITRPATKKAMLGLLADVGAKSVSIVYSTKDATTGLAKDVEKALAARGVKVTTHSTRPLRISSPSSTRSTAGQVRSGGHGRL
jgi:branched-chain amino acid transport system substrate-binding protein